MSDANSPVIAVSRVKPRNILKGIVPVASTFDTAPTNLANCTDGNITNPAGTGTKAMSAAGTIGALTFDLGSVKTVLIGFRVGVWGAVAAKTAMYIGYGDMAATQGGQCALNNSTSASSEVILSAESAAVITARYISFTFISGSTATTYNVKPYEFMAYELGV